ncbi:MAG: hypothetical protein AAGL18_12640, partial [Pseudomonadota bacterium]
GVIDIAAETARLDKELGKVTSEIQAIDKRLGNEAFVAKAPEAVVTETRTRREGFEAQREKLTGARKRLDDLVG